MNHNLVRARCEFAGGVCHATGRYVVYVTETCRHYSFEAAQDVPRPAGVSPQGDWVTHAVEVRPRDWAAPTSTQGEESK